MYGHPIAKELEGWWRDHAGRHDDPEWGQFISLYRELHDGKCSEMLSEHSNGGRFGMSKAGGCTRAAQLKWLGYDSEPLSGSSRATFFIGHSVEILALATLMACGYELSDFQAPLILEPMMQTTRDATIVLDGVRTLLSVKSSSYKKSGSDWKHGKRTWVRRGFPELPFEGVRKSQPGYWAQAQAECAAGGYEQALILFVAKDMIAGMKDDPYLGAKGNGSLTFYAEVISADQSFVAGALEPVWREGWEHVQTGSVGRGLFIHKTENRYVEITPTDDKANMAAAGMGYSPCRYCDFSDECQSLYLRERLQASIEMAEARV